MEINRGGGEILSSDQQQLWEIAPGNPGTQVSEYLMAVTLGEAQREVESAAGGLAQTPVRIHKPEAIAVSRVVDRPRKVS